MGEGDAQPPIRSRNLWAAWKLLNAAREARDPLDLDLPERRVVLDEHGKIAEIAIRERLDAHRVVEDFMIAANVAAAKALESKASPVVYRIHEPPSAREAGRAARTTSSRSARTSRWGRSSRPGLFNRMLKDIADDGEKALVMEAVLRSQTQAYYGPQNAGHFGLALGSYAHFTSPIRRYADLLVHRALVDAFQLEQPKPEGELPGEVRPVRAATAPTCRKSPTRSAMTERRAMEAERDTIDRYVAAWLSGRVGEVFDTRITGVQSFGFFATIVGLRRRRAGAGLDARAGTISATTKARGRWSAKEPATRYTVGDRLEAAAWRGQPADRRAQVRAARRRRRPRSSRAANRPVRGRASACKASASRGNIRQGKAPSSHARAARSRRRQQSATRRSGQSEK